MIFQRKTFYPLALTSIGVLLFLAIYLPSLNAPFQFDDYSTIVENPTIKNFQHLYWLWHSDPSRFLTHLSFAVNYHLGGLDVRGFHVFNWLIHLGVSFILFLIFKSVLAEIFRKYWGEAHATLVIFLCALVYLCHPVQTSAVTYLSQRSTLLAAFCYLSAIYFYVVYRQRDERSYYFFSLAVAAVGLFTKPIIITLPFALWLVEICFLSKKKDKRITLPLTLVPFFIMLIIVPMLLVLWKYKSFDISRFLDLTRETESISRKDYLLTQFNVMVTYLRLLFLPINQNLDYNYPLSRSFFDFQRNLSLWCV